MIQKTTDLDSSGESSDESADESPDEMSMYNEGRNLDKAQAIDWYEKKAQQNNPAAQFKLANC